MNKETYIVHFSYKKADGYWVYGATETLVIEGGKNNHNKAQALVENKYPNVKVFRVDLA